MCVLVCVLLQEFDLVNALNFCGRDRGAAAEADANGVQLCLASDHVKPVLT